jgi:hypothetical protein
MWNLFSQLKGRIQIVKVFRKKMLKRIFGTKKEKLRAGWRNQYKEKFNNLYSSTNIIMVTNSKKTR